MQKRYVLMRVSQMVLGPVCAHRGNWCNRLGQIADLGFVLQGVEPEDVLDPGYSDGALRLRPRAEVWRVAVTVEETGNAMVADGMLHVFQAGTPEAGEENILKAGTRLESVTTA